MHSSLSCPLALTSPLCFARIEQEEVDRGRRLQERHVKKAPIGGDEPSRKSSLGRPPMLARGGVLESRIVTRDTKERCTPRPRFD